MRFGLALAGVALIASPALAAPAWTVDKAASKIGFVSSMNGEAFEGSFARYDAKINFDPKDLKSSKAVIAIDVTSAATTN